MKSNKVLVTGGAGYIGSHTCVELDKAGYEIVVVDNYSNSNPGVFERLKELIGKEIKHYDIDCCNMQAFEKVFEENEFQSVIHFAGFKAVGESVEDPLKYFNNNLISSLNLITLMKKYEVKNLVFSSSCTVYGNPIKIPVDESEPLKVTNPYGRTKLMIEDMLRDFYNKNHDYNIALLRYFNPIGAHPSGLIGEDPNGIPNCLVPYISQVAIGRRDKLRVFGNDYDTIDGTGVRDYIHVCDLARGHVVVLDKLKTNCGLVFYNLGTGKGYSVFQVLKSMEKACGFEIPYEIYPRRSGDVPTCYSSCYKAYSELGWKAEYDLDKMCFDAWNFQKNNPNGYNK